jgi:gliding motility-associated-like protein
LQKKLSQKKKRIQLNKNLIFKALKLFIYAGFFCYSTLGIAQNIVVDNSFSAQQLIENNLVSGCVEVTNISSSINGSVNGFSSFGYFERSNSNFPFENGILLATGNASSGGNTVNTNDLSEGDTNWGTDPDLEAALGISNTLNATTIEFDFVSISNLIQFNYLLASEEYYANYPCDYSDGFAFLIKRDGTTDPYINIALIPGTNIPVNTNTIHSEIVGFCDAENEAFFDGYGLGDTNYNGRTTVLTASANIIPNEKYNIKLVIADQNDENFDSAVFIQGNSFNPIVDLGPDIITCADNYTLEGDIENPLANYAWYRDNELIPTAITPTINIDQSGVYRVEISITLNNIDCIIEDEISVTLNSEQTADNISDYAVCDDDTDGIALFDLTIKNDEIEAALPTSNYAISYHNSLSDAQNNINSLNTPIANTTNPQTIYVRVIDIDNGCLAYTSFDLIVYEIPDIINPETLILCDDNTDGFVSFDLSNNDSNITQGNSDLNVTYHYTQDDANAGINIIPQPYSNTNPEETLYVRVTNPLTGCVSTTTLNIEVSLPPIVNSANIQPLNLCLPEGEGFGVFDLTEALPGLLDGLTGVTVTFHESFEDAETGDNPITDITSFENTVENNQTLYIRIVDDITGCITIVPLEIHANILITATNLSDYEICDDVSADGIEFFDLTEIASNVINNLEDVTVDFYESQSDLEAGINPIDQSTPYEVSSSPHIIFMKLFSFDCSFDAPLTLIINPPIVLNTIGPIDYCDIDDDGFTTIELENLNSSISSDSSLTMTYFLTETDAINNINPLPETYDNTVNPQILYVRATNISSTCFITSEIEVNIITAPAVGTVNDIIICDDDQDGFSIINLEVFIPDFVMDTSGLTISFHNSNDDAVSNSNLITDTSTYNALTETIYTRVESSSTGCYSIVNLNIIVNTVPELIPISSFQNCETDGDQSADFIFSEKDDEIINGQTGKEVLYFETASDAINRSNSIDKTSPYTNTSIPQTIFVRIENITDENCFATSSFELEIGSSPDFNPPTNYLICDDESNDSIEIFDLNNTITEINQGSSENLIITFYESIEDAEAELNEIPLEYTNTSNPQQIYARIENGTYCYSIAEFGLNIVQVPSVNVPSDMTFCDNDYDGSITFDLTVSEFEILDLRDDDIVISYFEDEANLEANTNQITNPDSYQNITNPQTVFVKATNVVSNCFVSIPLNLIVNLPPSINDVPTIETCFSEVSTYNLSEATDILFDDTSGISISYHLSQSDAEVNQNALASTFNYTSTSTTIYIRAQYVSTLCTAISSFDLVINPNPIANTPPSMEACDDDYDFELVFDLSQQTSIIIGAQNASQVTVPYHETDVDALEGTNAILDTNYNAISYQLIFVRIENNDTGCFDTTLFQTIVNGKPLVEIPEQVICLDNLPLTVFAGELVSGDTYLWNTGETTSEIEIDTIGQYSVTVTSPFGCEKTTEFNVTASAPATIDFTETIDFSDPNNITVTISGIGNYLYQLDDNEPQTSNVFTNVPLGYHTVTVIDLNGCDSTTREVIVIDAPKFMTPNDDGYFDTWHISGVETIPGTTIFIYDRFGKQITYLTSTSRGWDGTYNGRKMPATDYWFVADVVKGGISFQLKGHFALRR